MGIFFWEMFLLFTLLNLRKIVKKKGKTILVFITLMALTASSYKYVTALLQLYFISNNVLHVAPVSKRVFETSQRKMNNDL